MYLFGLGKSDAVGSEVINGVPSPEESITQDGERASGLWEVHTHEGRDARALNLEDIVVWADGEVVAGKGEGQVRKRVTLAAVDGVLAVV